MLASRGILLSMNKDKRAMPTTINISDRFQRPGGTKPSYRVVEMLNFPGHLPHVKLISENADRRTITIGVDVLKDISQWVEIEGPR